MPELVYAPRKSRSSDVSELVYAAPLLVVVASPNSALLNTALRQLPTLEMLHLCNNLISDRGLAALIAQPMTGVLESLQLLDLRGNDITDAGCAALSSALRSGALPALKAVDLRDDEDDGFSPAHEDMFAARAGLVAFYELL